MSQPFSAGDNLVFQLESGFGVIRILAVEGEGSTAIWHLMVYGDFFPTVEAAELALAERHSLSVAKSHLPLTDRAFERTPTARVGHHELSDEEVASSKHWQDVSDRVVSDRSLLLMLGMR